MMTLTDLTARFSDTTENRQKAIFSTLFIAGNRLQTLFDSRIPRVSLKQFMLLSLVRQTGPLSLTRLGALLGCSRQNVKKIANLLEKKGFLALGVHPEDPRALCAGLTEQGEAFFQTEFAPYQQELSRLFQVYTEQEIETLFLLLTRLYQGIDRLEEENHE